MSDALQDLIELLDLEPIEVNIFRGVQPDEDRQRVFGGQVAGQALVAAARTVDEPGRRVALAARLLPAARRPGACRSSTRSIGLRDGRSFTTRRVVAIQHGRPIFNLQASFHDAEPGLDHHIDGTRPTCRRPSRCPTIGTRLEPHRDRIGDWYRPAAPDRHAVRAARSGDRTGGQDRRPTRLDACGRRAARRPRAARVHRHLRQRHDAARHRPAPVRYVVADRQPDDGEPRPRDVVPPPVPRRRMAAVRPAGDLELVGARAGRRVYLHRRRRSSSSTWFKKVSYASLS